MAKINNGYTEALKQIKIAKKENSRIISFGLLGLEEFPKEIYQLTHLQILDLTANRLTTIPESIGQLTHLNGLYLDGNQLTTLPESIGQLIKLQYLDLSNNRLTSLPETLKNCTSLKRLYLHNNEKLDLPKEVLGPSWMEAMGRVEKLMNPQDILEYYFRTRGGKKPLNEAKLILVGRGAVGKTSLVNRLVHNKFSRREKKTEGIKITNWSILLNEIEKIRLNIWDFGGQEIMHATHQFFLTQRSLYLLVLNGREGGEDADAEYWLKLIEAFGSGSPVIIVMNKTKEIPFDLNRSVLLQKYPFIRSFIKTDCKIGTGIKELRRIIEDETDKLEDLRAAFPAAWFKIKDKLPKMRKDFLGYEEFRKFCAKHGEKEEKAQSQLAGFLHDLGIALNYRDDPRLNDTHILNPHWVTSGIYKILNSADLEKRKGELTLGTLAKVLESKKYPPRMRNFLMELMRKFELCFTFPDNEGTYLIPELLDKQEPPETREFTIKECLNFQYHYTVLPEGLLPRFIVRTNVLSENLRRWRTGVILQFEGNKALVKSDTQDKKVYISINGLLEGRRRLLAIVRSDFERIHRDIKNLKPLEMIPLPEHPETVVPYDELLVMAEKKVETIQKVVAGEIVTIPIQSLLAGVDTDRSLEARIQASGRKESIPSSSWSIKPLRVFCSYSHKDERYREQMETHLKLLQRNGYIEIWHDRKITAGDEWKCKIDANLEEAEIILLLVSSDFIASNYCYDIEMNRAMERHEKGETRVIPIIVRNVSWKNTPFAKLEVLPEDGKAITLWPNRDTAWRDVSERIEKVVNEIWEKR